MPVSELGGDPASRGTRQEPDLDQVWLVHVLDRLRFLREGSGNGVEPNRPALELEDQRLQQLAVERLQAQLVDLEHAQRQPRRVDGRAPIAAHLRVIPHAAEQPVRDSGCAARTACNLCDRVVVNLDVEDARRPPHDALELRLVVKVQPVDGTKAITQRSAQQSLPCGRADAREMRQRQ